MIKFRYSSYEIANTFLTMLFSSLIGLFLGRAVNKSVNLLQGETSNKLQSFIFILVHLSLIITMFFFAFTYIYVRFRNIDNWIMSTIEGFLFASFFIENQTKLISNVTYIFP